MQKALLFILFILILSDRPAAAQPGGSPTEFEKLYNKGLGLAGREPDSAQRLHDRLALWPGSLSPVQKAQLSYLSLRIITSSPKRMAALEKRLFSAPDTLDLTDSLQFVAGRYLERSLPDKAIPLLMRGLEVEPKHSDRASGLVIRLCEAYRQKQEYKKGIAMLNELLADHPAISEHNKAYAYNRIAALYNEWGKPEHSFRDSVMKYSEACLAIAQRINSIPDLALSQNELSSQYLRKNEVAKALELSQKAVANFKSSGLVFQAINALLNQSSIYMRIKLYAQAESVLGEAASLSRIEENRNLFMRIYDQFSWVYDATGNYRNAYEMLLISHRLHIDFFKDRINVQINELSAKYDLLVKEKKISEEKKKNEFSHRQILLLIIILVILCIVFVLSLFYIRLKREDVHRQKMMEAIAETETKERARIARDLHDGLGPMLSAIHHYYQAFIDAQPNERFRIQDRLEHVISDSIDEVSRISHNISPHILEKYGLTNALQSCIETLSCKDRIRIDFTTDFDERFDLKKELTVYRCITELINNTIRHADATLIVLNIRATDRFLHVDYIDNGRGMDLQSIRNKGMGLYNLRNRIESYRGKIVFDSSPGNGVHVTFEIPR